MNGKAPTAIDIYSTLIDLLAQQEGIKISCILEGNGKKFIKESGKRAELCTTQETH